MCLQVLLSLPPASFLKKQTICHRGLHDKRVKIVYSSRPYDNARQTYYIFSGMLIENFHCSSLSAPGCELTPNMDDRLAPLFLTFLFFPCLPFIIVVGFVLAGFCGQGLKDIEIVKSNFNPFVFTDTTMRSDEGYVNRLFLQVEQASRFFLSIAVRNLYFILRLRVFLHSNKDSLIFFSYLQTITFRENFQK